MLFPLSSGTRRRSHAYSSSVAHGRRNWRLVSTDPDPLATFQWRNIQPTADSRDGVCAPDGIVYAEPGNRIAIDQIIFCEAFFQSKAFPFRLSDGKTPQNDDAINDYVFAAGLLLHELLHLAERRDGCKSSSRARYEDAKLTQSMKRSGRLFLPEGMLQCRRRGPLRVRKLRTRKSHTSSQTSRTVFRVS